NAAGEASAGFDERCGQRVRPASAKDSVLTTSTAVVRGHSAFEGDIPAIECSLEIECSLKSDGPLSVRTFDCERDGGGANRSRSNRGLRAVRRADTSHHRRPIERQREFLPDSGETPSSCVWGIVGI